MIKILANRIREVKDANLLSFSFSHPLFDRTSLNPIYLTNIKLCKWQIWLPKKGTHLLSQRNRIWCLDNELFEKSLNKDIVINGNNINLNDFKNMFIKFKSPSDAEIMYNSILQLSLSESKSHRRVPYLFSQI